MKFEFIKKIASTVSIGLVFGFIFSYVYIIFFQETNVVDEEKNIRAEEAPREQTPRLEQKYILVGVVESLKEASLVIKLGAPLGQITNRKIQISDKTVITHLVPKDPSLLQKELQDYNNSISSGEAISSTSPKAPSPTVEESVSLVDLKIGDSISIQTSDDPTLHEEVTAESIFLTQTRLPNLPYENGTTTPVPPVTVIGSDIPENIKIQVPPPIVPPVAM